MNLRLDLSAFLLTEDSEITKKNICFVISSSVCRLFHSLPGNESEIINKVITIMVIRPLDDPTYVLNLWSPIYDPSVWGYVRIGVSSFGSPSMYSY